MHISPYEQGNIFNKDPLRDRKLLLNKREILRLSGLINQKGYTLVPISLYFKNNIEINDLEKRVLGSSFTGIE